MRKLLALLSCLLLVAALASCSASGGSDAGGDDPATPAVPDDDVTEPTATSEPDDDDTSTTVEDDDTTTTTDDEDPEPSPGGDTDAYVESLVTGMSSGDDGEDLVLSTSEAECVAPAWVDALGDDLAAFAPEDLANPNFDFSDEIDIDEDQAEAMIAAYGDCDVDIEALFVDYIAADVDAEQAACIEAAFEEFDLTGLLAAILVDEDAAQDAYQDDLTTAFSGCVPE